MTEDISSIVVLTGVLVPASRHLPFVVQPIVRADQDVHNFDLGAKALLLEKLAHVRHEFADVEVVIS